MSQRLAQGDAQAPPAKKYSTTMRRTIGGALGGACEALTLHPLDTVKTRMQLQVAKDGQLQYKNALHCAKTISKQEGTRALYKGLSPFVVHLVTKYSLRFYINFSIRSLVADAQGRTTSTQNFFAGLTSGMVEAVMIVTPFEVVKIRLQKQRGQQSLKYNGPINCARTIVGEEGVLALWKGVTPTIFRNSINQAFNFASYDIIKRNLWYSEQDPYPLALWQTILTGATAGAIGPLCNSPCDVLKTRLMSQDSRPGQIPKYRGFAHGFMTMWREEGFLSMWKGIGPRLARLAPGQAITWSVVEKVNQYFDELEAEALS